ncbi:MAG: SUF system Fe-S cluster assembly protein [Mariprofundales bacterium]
MNNIINKISPLETLKERVIHALKTIYDPEIPVNIYELGLIYRVNVNENGYCHIQMTLTTPGCPVAQTFPLEVESRVEAVLGIASAEVELVWEPPWDHHHMSEAAKLELGFL